MKQYFNDIPKIKFEGKDSKNPLAFKYYDSEKMVNGKKMKDIFRFSVAYWHTFAADGSDPFGAGTYQRPWNDIKDPMESAKEKANANFEFLEKIGVDYFCFHDRDIAYEGKTLRESNEILDEVVDHIEVLMKETGKKLLWGTANCFSNPRYMHGAGTSCNADVFAFAGAQIKKAMEVTKRLNGENYVFWGGREGYDTLLNTDMKLELDNFARLLKMAVDYKKEIGFNGTFLIEPKPKEPTKHQYDFDVATVYGFLKKYGLENEFKMNIEANHATFAGHTFEHDLHVARINNILGSIDANQGETILGWDTDNFPSNLYSAVLSMYEVLKNGGIGTGGFNFDAKNRRGSFELKDLFYGHILGMDTFAKGLLVADRLLKDGIIEKMIENRYSSFSSGIGSKIVSGTTFSELESYILDKETVKVESGRQELYEIILNDYLLKD